MLGLVYENLLSLVQNECATISGITGKAKQLPSNLDEIHVVVKAAEKRVVKHAKKEQKQYKDLQLWLEELKDAVYELDDIFDEYSIKSLGLRGFSFFKPKNIMFRYEISKRLKEITRRFDEIAKRGRNFTLDVEELQTGDDKWRQTISIDDQSQIYGRDDDKKRIVEFLLKQARGSHFLSIYPIVGLGGVGKTTLAYLVFNDECVNNNFSIKMWVCVSKSLSLKRIPCSIIEAVTHENYDALQLDEIERNV